MEIEALQAILMDDFEGLSVQFPLFTYIIPFFFFKSL